MPEDLRESPSQLEARDRPRWLLIGLVTLLGATGLIVAWLLKTGDARGFGQNVLVELCGALALAGVLLLLEKAMVQEVRRTVRTEIDGLRNEQRRDKSLDEALEQAARRAGRIADTMSARGKAQLHRARAMTVFLKLLTALQRELESPKFGLKAALSNEFDEDNNVLGWNPTNFHRGDMDERASACRTGEPTDDEWSLLIEAAVGARVGWTLAAATRLCADGALQLAVGSIIIPINPQGRDSQTMTLNFMNEMMDRQVGYRRVIRVSPDLSDFGEALDAAADQLKRWVPPSLDAFYDLTQWTEGFAEYEWRR